MRSLDGSNRLKPNNEALGRSSSTLPFGIHTILQETDANINYKTPSIKPLYSEK